MPILFALAVVASTADQKQAMERCAERVIALRHPRMGMADLTDTSFEWLSLSGAGGDWVIIGSIIEPERGARVAHRFTCRRHGERTPRVTFGKTVRL